MQIITLSRDPQRNWKAFELSKEDLKEHYEAISAAEGTLRDFRNSIKGKTKGDEEITLPKPE